MPAGRCETLWLWFLRRIVVLLPAAFREEWGDELLDTLVTRFHDRVREWVDAEIALNTDAGAGLYDPNGEPQMFSNEREDLPELRADGFQCRWAQLGSERR